MTTKRIDSIIYFENETKDDLARMAFSLYQALHGLKNCGAFDDEHMPPYGEESYDIYHARTVAHLALAQVHGETVDNSECFPHRIPLEELVCDEMEARSDHRLLAQILSTREESEHSYMCDTFMLANFDEWTALFILITELIREDMTNAKRWQTLHERLMALSLNRWKITY